MLAALLLNQSTEPPPAPAQRIGPALWYRKHHETSSSVLEIPREEVEVFQRAEPEIHFEALPPLPQFQSEAARIDRALERKRKTEEIQSEEDELMQVFLLIED